MMDTYIGPLDTSEEAFDEVGVRPVLGHELAAVVESDGFADFHEQDPCGLVLDPQLSGQMESGHALHCTDLLPDRHDDRLEGQLAVGEDGSGCHREFASALVGRATETAAADAVRIKGAADRAIRLSIGLRPAEIVEDLIGVIIVEIPDILRADVPGLFRQQEMLRTRVVRIRPTALRMIVFRTSGPQLRRDRTYSDR